jgi:hypothetical protein
MAIRDQAPADVVQPHELAALIQSKEWVHELLLPPDKRQHSDVVALTT